MRLKTFIKVYQRLKKLYAQSFSLPVSYTHLDVYKRQDMACAALLQQIVHVLKKLDVPPLVAGDGDAVRVFLDGTLHNLQHGAVVS